MTGSLSQSLQAALYEAMVSDPTLQQLIGANIFDDPVPVEGSKPSPEYVTIGEESVRAAGSATSSGAIHDVNIIVNSATSGFKSSKDIAAAICDLLHEANLTLSRGHLVYLRFLRSRAKAGRPPLKRRISLTFRAFVEDTTS